MAALPNRQNIRAEAAPPIAAALQERMVSDSDELIAQVLRENRRNIARFGADNSGDVHQEMYVKLRSAVTRYRSDVGGAKLHYLRATASGAIRACWQGIKRCGLPLPTKRRLQVAAISFSDLEICATDIGDPVSHDLGLGLLLTEFFAELPEPLRRIALLLLGGYTTHEIAKIIGRTDSRVRQHRRALRKWYCQYWQFCDTEGRRAQRRN